MNLPKLILALASAALISSCGDKRETSGDHIAAALKLAGDSANAGVGGATLYAQQQVEAMVIRSVQGYVTRTAESDAPSVSPQATVTISSASSTCPGGTGTSTTSGTADISQTVTGTSPNTTTTITFNDMDITSTFTDCVVTGDDGKNYTVNGSMSLTNVTGSYAIAIEGTSFTISSTMTLPLSGTITIAGESETKSDCVLDITSTNTLSSSGASLSGTAEWSGTACGVSTSGSTTFSGDVPSYLLEI